MPNTIWRMVVRIHSHMQKKKEILPVATGHGSEVLYVVWNYEIRSVVR